MNCSLTFWVEMSPCTKFATPDFELEKKPRLKTVARGAGFGAFVSLLVPPNLETALLNSLSTF